METKTDSKSKKPTHIPVEKIGELRFVDKDGRVYQLDRGRVNGEYLLRVVES